MKKVVFVASVAKHIEAFHYPALKMFQENGYQTYVIANGSLSSPYINTFISMEFTRFPLSISNFKCYFKLKKILAKEKFDIISCHTPAASVITRLAAKKDNSNVFYMAHGFHFYKGGHTYTNLIYYTIEKFMAHYTDELITINYEDFNVAKKFKLRNNGKIHYVPGVGISYQLITNAVVKNEQLRLNLGIPINAFLIISVGELNENKNHIAVLKAINSLKNDDIYYIICGKGDKYETYSKYIEDHDLTNISLLGFRNDIINLYKISDLLVFPSFREGLPVSVMEAMASGLPVIASNIRGCSDLIVDNENGFLVEPESYESIKEKILMIKNCPDLANRFKQMNIAKARNYDSEIILKQLKKIYLK